MSSYGCPGPKGGITDKIWGCDLHQCSDEKRCECVEVLTKRGYKIEFIGDKKNDR